MEQLSLTNLTCIARLGSSLSCISPSLYVWRFTNFHTLLILTLLLCNVSFAQIQDPELIKYDPNYVWGEGRAKTREGARHLAVDDLISRISTTIISTSVDRQGERTGTTGYEWYDEFVTVMKSFSSIYLKGLNYVEKRRWRSWEVTAFITKNSVSESFRLRKDKIKEFTLTGLRASREGRVGEALRNYYWGYLLARVYPDTINVLQRTGESSRYADVMLLSLMKSAFEDINVRAHESYKDGFAIMVPLRFSFHGKDVSELHFSYYSGVGTDYAIVEDGFADIPIYDEPIKSTRKLTISVEFAYEGEMAMDEEIRTLHSMFGTVGLNNRKTVNIHFPWLGATAAKPDRLLGYTEAVPVLMETENTSDLLDVLEQYRKLGIIRYGQRNDFGRGENCWVAIASDEKVIEILFYDGRTYTGLETGSTYSSLAPYFKGKRAIWFTETN